MALLARPPIPPSYTQRLSDGPKPYGHQGDAVQQRGQDFLKEFASRPMISYYTSERTQTVIAPDERVSLAEIDDLQTYESPLVVTRTQKVRRLLMDPVAPSYLNPFDEDGFPLP